jgi:hypothetical protein
LSGQRHNIESWIIADANHEMMFPANETMQQDATTDLDDAPQAPAYFIVLGSWLFRLFHSPSR